MSRPLFIRTKFTIKEHKWAFCSLHKSYNNFSFFTEFVMPQNINNNTPYNDKTFENTLLTQLSLP